MKKNAKILVMVIAAIMLLAGCEKPSSEKRIINFAFNSISVTAVVDENTKTIEANVPYGTNVTALVPAITVSDKAVVIPASGVAQNFRNPVTYTVTAEDGSQAVYTVTVSVNIPSSCIVNVSANPSDGGIVSGGGTYLQGRSCTVSATANNGYTFNKWTENGNQVSNSANYTFIVNGGRNLVANFINNGGGNDSYIVTVLANPSSGGSVSGSGTYQQGQTCTVRAVANTGYTFTNWTENGSQVSINANYTFTINNNRTLVANFIPNTQIYTINVSKFPENGGSVTGGGTYQQGQYCSVKAICSAGYIFKEWAENGNIVSNSATYTFIVSDNRTLVANFELNASAPIGAINGLFSVSTTKQVWFSQGNLQYRASTSTWRFATNQWDYVGTQIDDGDGYYGGTVSGSDNCNISSSYSGWIDLFGWGTSGWNCGNTYFRPWDSNIGNLGKLYGPPGKYNLAGSYANSDWGVYNRISNGGNVAGQWRTLTKDEWVYVFSKRSTLSGIRYAKAKVANVNGVILLPDNWSVNTYNLINTNNGDASYSCNVITASQWNMLQNAGAVFLPAAGARDDSYVYWAGGNGCYWSASYFYSQSSYNQNDHAYAIFIHDEHYPYGLMLNYWDYRNVGHSVRLVCPAN